MPSKILIHISKEVAGWFSHEAAYFSIRKTIANMNLVHSIPKVKLHGRNMANVYEEIDKSVLPDEYLPDDYTGPSAGPVSQVLGEANYGNLRIF